MLSRQLSIQVCSSGQRMELVLNILESSGYGWYLKPLDQVKSWREHRMQRECWGWNSKRFNIDTEHWGERPRRGDWERGAHNIEENFGAWQDLNQSEQSILRWELTKMLLIRVQKMESKGDLFKPLPWNLWTAALKIWYFSESLALSWRDLLVLAFPFLFSLFLLLLSLLHDFLVSLFFNETSKYCKFL
jgi:hypothetical protein